MTQPVARVVRPVVLIFSILATFGALGFVLAPSLFAQEPAAQPAAKPAGAGWLWLEQFSGSSSSDGQVMALTSTSGYNFNSHVGLFAGLPVYFIHTSSSVSSAGAADGIGDVFFGVRLAAQDSVVNYRTTFTGAAPTGDAAKGLGTGHFTFDWSNHFDHRFGRITPFANLGIANSIPDTLFYQRQFLTYGYLAHFQGGGAVRLIGPLSAIVSAYDIEPWGSQTVDSRLIPSGATGLLGGITDGRVFDMNHQTTGGSSLTRDYGASAGLDVNLHSVFDIWGGYNRSVPLHLNIVSFGVGVNVSNLLHSTRG